MVATDGSVAAYTTPDNQLSQSARSDSTLATIETQSSSASSSGFSFLLERWQHQHPDPWFQRAQSISSAQSISRARAFFEEKLARWDKVYYGGVKEDPSLAMLPFQDHPRWKSSTDPYSAYFQGQSVLQRTATPTSNVLDPPRESNDQPARLLKNAATRTSSGSSKSVTPKTISGFTHQTPTSATSQGSVRTATKIGIRSILNVVDPVDDALTPGEITETSSEATDESEDSLNSGTTPEKYERLANPRQYFRKLKLLEESIYMNSALFFHASSSSQSQFQMPFPEYYLLEDTDPEMFDEFRIARAEGHLQQIEGVQLHLFHLCKIMFSVYLNLMRLKLGRYCADFISLLVQDPDRPEHVAKLVPLPLSKVRQLTQAFSYACRQKGYHPTGDFNLNRECDDILVLLGILSTHNKFRHSEPQSPSAIYMWYCVVHTLDLAVLSYSGAHIENFDDTYLEVRKESFEIPREFLVLGEFEQPQGIGQPMFVPPVTLRRRSLQCLDNFLHRDVWVFHTKPENVTGNGKLYLQTDVRTLADIWGPLWASCRKSKPGEIYEFNVGNGTILPWSNNPDQQEHAIPSVGEIFCHWVSWREPLANIKLLQKNLVKRFFHLGDSLLIGASPNSILNLKSNSGCQRSLVDIKQDLSYIHALNRLKTARREMVKDSQTFGVTAGGLGVTASATKTYKRREGQTWKDALAEDWRDLEFVNPVYLEYYVGLEISLCTRNARRIRLLDVLGTKTMALYLKGRDFRWGKWGEHLEKKYFRALKSPEDFYKLWKVRKYRETVGKAISRCIDALAETGVDELTGALDALWVVEATTQPMRESGEVASTTQKVPRAPVDESQSGSGSESSDDEVTFTEEYIMSLFRSEHTWTRFLKDTRDTMTMAVVEDNCLELHHEHGRRCTSDHIAEDGKLFRWVANGYPVLQTSLEINERLLEKEGIVKEEPEGARPYWDVRDIKKKARFRLGEQGILELFELPKSSHTSRKGKAKMTSQANDEPHPLVVEWYGVKSETVRETIDVDIKETFYGENPKEHHTEYSSTALPTRPIPVFILSNSRKIGGPG